MGKRQRDLPGPASRDSGDSTKNEDRPSAAAAAEEEALKGSSA